MHEVVLGLDVAVGAVHHGQAVGHGGAQHLGKPPRVLRVQLVVQQAAVPGARRLAHRAAGRLPQLGLQLLHGRLGALGLEPGGHPLEQAHRQRRRLRQLQQLAAAKQRRLVGCLHPACLRGWGGGAGGERGRQAAAAGGRQRQAGGRRQAAGGGGRRRPWGLPAPLSADPADPLGLARVGAGVRGAGGVPGPSPARAPRPKQAHEHRAAGSSGAGRAARGQSNRTPPKAPASQPAAAAHLPRARTPQNRRTTPNNARHCLPARGPWQQATARPAGAFIGTARSVDCCRCRWGHVSVVWTRYSSRARAGAVAAAAAAAGRPQAARHAGVLCQTFLWLPSGGGSVLALVAQCAMVPAIRYVALAGGIGGIGSARRQRRRAAAGRRQHLGGWLAGWLAG